MKKILICILCLFSVSAWATACADGKGWIAEGRDQKTTYCVSNVRMNWWSAFAWCASIGGELFDVNKECKKETIPVNYYSCYARTDPCPNVCGRQMDNAWTVNTIDDETAVTVNGWAGNGTSQINNYKKVNLRPAICIITK